MIGIVVVTHGALAGELVNATRTIVGDIPAIAAVSIGWTDDMNSAREAIERAVAEVGGGDVLILTDMFGGPHQRQPALPVSRVEIVTGVNLPMLIKLTSLREGELVEVARVIREQGKSAIYVASEILEKKPS